MAFPAQMLHRLATARAQENGTPRFVSGAALAADFNVTRSAIWKSMRQLRALGAEIDAITHRGYRLALPISSLTTGGVLERLPGQTRARLRHGECAAQVESTNSELLSRPLPPAGGFDFLTAEYQNAGRGRRGRQWLAPPGSAICLSWSWCFEGLAANLGALSLAVGVGVRRALASLGIDGIGLKWPNDLMTQHGKLGGILIEMRSEISGPVHVVVGLGLNVALGEKVRNEISLLGTAATDLAQFCGASPTPHREPLVAALLQHGVAAMSEFAQSGLVGFLDEYRSTDTLNGQAVRILGQGEPLDGMACGIDDDGALKVQHSGRIHRIIAGEVSVRTT